METGWSKSRISRLGKALISTSPPPVERLEELHELLIVYDEALDVAVARIREHTAVQTTSRLKNTGTILEKLRRSGGGSLGNIQDLAGIRIVLDCDLIEQARFARRIEKIFSAEARPPKLVDRRFESLRGYRAIHVVVSVDGRPVEVQIRTRLQHQWANLFEKLADIVGRGIRYGEPPDEWTVLFEVDVESPQNLVDLLVTRFEALSDEIRVCEMASTFHGNPEPVEQANPPDELPSLEEVEWRKEIVLETARAIETMLFRIVSIRERFKVGLEAFKRELVAAGGVSEDAELDREVLRAELRRRVSKLGNDSRPAGDDVVPADGNSGEG